MRGRSKTLTGTMFPLRLGRAQGRVTVRIDAKGYPVFKSGFYRDQRVHRVVAAATKERALTKDEDVHHHDGNKRNFDPENLEVLSKAQHGWESAVQHFYVPHVIADRERQQWEEWTGERLA